MAIEVTESSKIGRVRYAYIFIDKMLQDPILAYQSYFDQQDQFEDLNVTGLNVDGELQRLSVTKRVGCLIRATEVKTDEETDEEMDEE